MGNELRRFEKGDLPLTQMRIFGKRGVRDGRYQDTSAPPGAMGVRPDVP